MFWGGTKDNGGGAFTSIFNVAPLLRESDEKKKNICFEIFENILFESFLSGIKDKDINKQYTYLRKRYRTNERAVSAVLQACFSFSVSLNCTRQPG